MGAGEHYVPINQDISDIEKNHVEKGWAFSLAAISDWVGTRSGYPSHKLHRKSFLYYLSISKKIVNCTITFNALAVKVHVSFLQ